MRLLAKSQRKVYDMWPYILLIACPIVFHHSTMKDLYSSESGLFKENSEKAMKLFWGGVFMLLALRHENVGTDVSNYHNFFESISRSSWEKVLSDGTEIGYSLLNKIVSVSLKDFRWFLIIVAALSVYFIAKVYIKFSNDATLSIALVICMSNFVMMFSGLRQAIAISIGFLAFEFVREKKLFKFLLIVAIAMLFHISAFMLVFMYPVYHIRLTRNSLVAIIPVMGFVFLFNKQIFSILGSILSKYTDYDATISLTGAYSMLILFVLFAIFAYLIADEPKLDNDTIGLRNFLLLSIVLQMFAPLHTISMRMNYYYIAFIPLLLPRIIENRSKTWNQIAIIARYVMVVFFIAFFFITALEEKTLNAFPYRFFWEDALWL